MYIVIETQTQLTYKTANINPYLLFIIPSKSVWLDPFKDLETAYFLPNDDSNCPRKLTLGLSSKNECVYCNGVF